jgi:uncharacterized membrane protein YqjE
MQEVEDREPRMPASGLFRSLSNLLATIIAFAQTRLELLTTELQEEIQHAAGMLVWGFIALLSAGVGLVFVGVTIIVVYWDSQRVLAAILVTAAFVVLAVISVVVLVMKTRNKPRLLDATRTELLKDRDQLESHR